MNEIEKPLAPRWEPFEKERLKCHACGLVSVDPPKFGEPDYLACPGRPPSSGET